MHSHAERGNETDNSPPAEGWRIAPGWFCPVPMLPRWNGHDTFGSHAPAWEREFSTHFLFSGRLEKLQSGLIF